MMLYETALSTCLAPNDSTEKKALAATATAYREDGKTFSQERYQSAAFLNRRKARIRALEDLVGPVSALDQPIRLTRFPSQQAFSKKSLAFSLRELERLINHTRAATKKDLPWLKLANFGHSRTEKNCLRNDANVRSISGVEIDYDGHVIAIDEAARRFHEAGVAALLYSTPSSTAERPRWRALVVFADEQEPERRIEFVERLNAIFDGEVDQHASFALSQAFYYGNAVDGEPIETRLVDGEFIDRLGDLPRLPKGEKRHGDSDEDDDLTYHVRDDSGSGQLWRLAYDWKNRGGSIAERTGGFRAEIEANPQIKAHVKRNGERAVQRVWDRTPNIADELDDLPPVQDEPVLSRLTFLSPSDCEAAEARGYLLKGMIAPGDIGCIFGAPGVGKSLIAPHIGYAVSQGRSAFGMRSKGGRVFYVAAEDETGMKGRIRALKERWGDAPDFRLVAGCSNLMSKNSPDLRALVKAIKSDCPKLIFIDTMAMAFPGLEENDAASMGKIVAIARALASSGAAVILVHHDTKEAGGTPRGHSLFNGALDMALHLTKSADGVLRKAITRNDDGIVRGTLTKNRNGTCNRDVAFRIVAREFGNDEDGDAITAALVEELDQVHRQVPLTNAEKAALNILSEELNGTADERDWRQACEAGRSVSAAEKQDSRRRIVIRVISQLVDKGVVFFGNQKYSIYDWGDDSDDHS